MTANHESSIVNVISQNVLHDVRRTREKLILPQDDRIPSLAATLQAFPGSLDVVGIQEAYRNAAQHNGEVLAEACGYGPGFWVEHNQKQVLTDGKSKGRSGEHVGLFGAMVDHAEPVELGDNRRAAMTIIDGIAYATFHFRSGRQARYLRYEQARALNEATEEHENMVVFGDLNEPPIRGYALARAELARAGFRSIFPLTHQRYPITSPIPSYKEAAMNGRSRLEARFVDRGWPIDDILVRGPRVRVLIAGVLDRVIIPPEREVPEGVPLEGSDHEGIWARLEISCT